MLLLALQFGKVRSDWSGVLCGPWGCTAPLEAVLAMHMVWFLILIPVVIGTAGRHSLRWKRWSFGLLFLSLGGAIWLAIGQSGTMTSSPPFVSSEYFWKQWGLALVGCVDVPLIPAFILAPLCLLGSRLNK